MTTRGFPTLSLGRVDIEGSSKMTCLRAVSPMSYVFLSPTHHGRRNKGAITVSSYRPGITRLRKLLLDGTGQVVVGLSPVLSLSRTLGRLPRARRMRVVSIGGRYGRLLLLLKRATPRRVPIRYMGLSAGKRRRGRLFMFAHRRRRRDRYDCASALNGCLCRPGTSLLGTNTFHDVTTTCSIGGLRPGDRLCASSARVRNFPNEAFHVVGQYDLGGGRVGRGLSSLGGTGVAIHGFPTAITRLHGHVGLTRKKSACLFTDALGSKRGVLVHYKGI